MCLFFVVADIPGLMKGAHQNIGLGFSFLRHIERCSCLLFVIDLSSASPAQQLEDLKFELEQYREGLSQRPRAVVANKLDLPMAPDNLVTLQENVDRDMPVIAVSAKHKENIGPLVSHIRLLYDNHAKMS